MILIVEICPPIHNIVVVTSPIGVHAPPALAAMMIIPAKNNRISLFGMSVLINETMTIDVVRLSSTADKKNVIQQIIHKSNFGFFVLIVLVITLKP
jgi:hypothetical protein